jgi:ABC-type glycerol-3-phosphate transport system substrate-binding protein
MRWRALLAAAATVLLAACGGTGGAGSGSSDGGSGNLPSQLNGPVTIDYWSFYAPPTGLAVQATVDRFNQLYSGKITVRLSYQGNFDQLSAKVRAAAAGGGLPQVVTAREQDMPPYVTAGLTVPLDPYVSSAKWGLSSKEHADLTPGSLSRTKLPMYGNKTLTWPFANSAAIWYANLDLLQQAGVAKAPGTWDQVATDAGAVRSRTGKAGWLMQQNSLGPNFIDTLWTYGVPWLARNGTSTNFNTPQAVQILTTWRKMVQDGSMLLTSSTDQSEFVGGAGAMEMASSGYAIGAQFGSRIKGFHWDAGILPQKQGTQPVTELYGSVNTMIKSTPQQQLASWLFMKYVASTQNQGPFAAQAGFAPTTRSSVDSPEMKAVFAQNPQFKSAVDVITSHAQLPPQSTALTQIRTGVANDDVLQVLLGQLSPQDGAKKLAFDADKALEQTSS